MSKTKKKKKKKPKKKKKKKKRGGDQQKRLENTGNGHLLRSPCSLLAMVLGGDKER